MKFLLPLLFISSIVAYGGDFELSAHFEGASYAVASYGNYAYYATGGDIHILDISDPQDIRELKVYIEDNNLPIQDMAIWDHYLFMTSSGDGVKIFDLADPLNPEYISHAYHTHEAHKEILFSEETMILVSSSFIQIFSIEDILNPTYLGSFALGVGEKGRWDVHGQMLYNSGHYGMDYHLCVVGFDLTDPSHPVLSVSLDLNASSSSIRLDALEISGNLLYAAYDDTVKIFDISSRDTIIYLTQFATEAPVYGITACQETLFIGMETGTVEWMDLSSIFSPEILGQYNAPGLPEEMMIKETILFLPLSVDGFHAVDISDAQEPELIYENTNTKAFRIIHKNNNLLFFSHLPDGLQAYDFSDLMHPEPLGEIKSFGGSLSEIKSVPGFLYCRPYPDTGIYIVDVRDPESLLIIDTIRETLWGSDYFIHGKRLYIRTVDKRVKIYDLTIPEAPVKVDSFNVEGYNLTGNDSLFILSFSEYSSGMKSDLLLYRFTGDSAQLMDKLELGDYDDYRVLQLEFDFPYVLARTMTGMVIVKISDTLKFELTSQISDYSTPTHLCYDEKYLYLSGGRDGMSVIDIFNWEDPSYITLYKTIERYSGYLAVRDSILISSERYGGFSIYGYYPLGFQTFSSPESGNRLKVFPNPAGEKVTIECAGVSRGPIEKRCLRIFDLQGREVLEEDIPAGTVYYDISTAYMKPGIYLFGLSGKDGQISTCKIIIN